MFRLLQLAVLLLVSLAHGFSVQPGMLSVRGAAPACEMKLALRTNDMVKVISGDDKGTVGKLLSIDKKKMQVVVEGVNVRTKHVKPMKEGESGSLVKKEMPIHMSNVALSTEQPAAPAAAE